MEIVGRKSIAEYRDFYKEYIYPKPQESVAKRKKPTGKNSSGRKYAVIILIILALTAALLLSDYLSSGLAIGLFKKNQNNIALKAADYCAAETGAFTSLRAAEACAAETVEAGGAGYIYNDGTFHVLASVHAKKADADTSAKAYDGADIFTLKIPAKTVAYSGNKAEKEAVRAAFAAPLTVFSQMADISARLKSGGLTVSQSLVKLQALETETQAALDKLNAADGEETPMAVIRIKAELTVIINILSDMADSETDGVELRRGIDYNAIKILCSYKDMINEI